ncbi:hypothetical protein CEXT_735181 [Caerostris extrusa]|uniref:Uncharacterized protein n=1 Tax=Caerostris extrusa TaxID=172846 RepID=A0AAV4UVB7_CAEEX|nr:hypothetical protein CEXT_735181 [Caerostris extrusa]
MTSVNPSGKSIWNVSSKQVGMDHQRGLASSPVECFNLCGLEGGWRHRANYRYPVLGDSIDPIGHQSRKSVRGLFPRIAHNARGEFSVLFDAVSIVSKGI